MALVFADRVKVRSRTIGTGTFVLENTFSGFQSFEAIGDGNETYYSIVDNSGNWEIGLGTYTALGMTLSRDQVISSSNNNQLVDFPIGSKNVFSTIPSSFAGAFTFDGSYNSLTNTPSIPEDISDLTDTGNLLFDGSYNSLTNTPSIPSNITDLTDISNTIPNTGQALVWNGEIWEPGNVATGSGAGVNIDGGTASTTFDGTTIVLNGGEA